MHLIYTILNYETILILYYIMSWGETLTHNNWRVLRTQFIVRICITTIFTWTKKPFHPLLPPRFCVYYYYRRRGMGDSIGVIPPHRKTVWNRACAHTVSLTYSSRHGRETTLNFHTLGRHEQFLVKTRNNSFATNLEWNLIIFVRQPHTLTTKPKRQ